MNDPLRIHIFIDISMADGNSAKKSEVDKMKKEKSHL